MNGKQALEALERAIVERKGLAPTLADIRAALAEPAAVPDPIKFARCERCSTSYPLQDAASHRCRPVGNGMFQIWHEPYVVPPEPAAVPEVRPDVSKLYDYATKPTDGPLKCDILIAGESLTTLTTDELDRLRAWEAWAKNHAVPALEETERRCERNGWAHSEISGALAAAPRQEKP